MDNSLSVVDTMIETTFEENAANEADKAETGEQGAGVKRAYAPFKSKSETSNNSIKTEINFKSKPSGDEEGNEPKEEAKADVADDAGEASDLKIDLKDLAAIARARAAKPKKMAAGHMVKAF